MYTTEHLRCIVLYIYICICILIHICICILIHICICINTYMYIYMYINTYMYMYQYIYIYISNSEVSVNAQKPWPRSVGVRSSSWSGVLGGLGSKVKSWFYVWHSAVSLFNGLV